jgi:hypothetical protein
MKANFGKAVKGSFTLIAFLSGSTFFIVASTANPSYARPRECEAKFTVQGISTDWISLGEVGGFLANKKKQCLERAEGYARDTLNINDFKGADISQEVCRQESAGGIEVDVDTKVDGKQNSRDGSIRSMLQVACVNTPTS